MRRLLEVVCVPGHPRLYRHLQDAWMAGTYLHQGVFGHFGPDREPFASRTHLRQGFAGFSALVLKRFAKDDKAGPDE